jgi:hypothetical protein
MNEQIKKLAADARGQMVVLTTVDDEQQWRQHEEFVEKFAELIVRECIDVVGKATASPNGYQALMKHFGVEE